MERQEVAGIFHAKRVILRMSVYSLPSHEKRAVIGIPSPELKIAIIKQNSPGLLIGMDGTRGFG